MGQEAAEGGVTGGNGEAGEWGAETGWRETEGDRRRGRSEGVQGKEEDREVLEGPTGARGVGGEPGFLEEWGAPELFPTQLGDLQSQSLLVCTRRKKTWALSSGDGSETR